MRQHIDEFVRLTGDLAYRPKAVFPSEMFLFYCEALAAGADHIIETGVGFGGSTSYLARLFPDARITCIDDDSRRQLEVVAREIGGKAHFLRGDAVSLLPKVVKHSRGNSLAILIDGPKGRPAVALAKEVLQDVTVKFVAVHDLAFEAKEYLIDSHAEDFRAQFGFLDCDVGEARIKHPAGPGLKIFRC